MDRHVSTDRWMGGQTRVKTLPSRRTTYAGGNNMAGKARPQKNWVLKTLVGKPGPGPPLDPLLVTKRNV